MLKFRVRFFLSAVLIGGFLTATVRADLALTAGGTDIFADQYGTEVALDEHSVARDTGLSNFKMFGRTLPSTMHVSVNGVLASRSLDYFYPTKLGEMPDNTQVIAPMFDDVLLLRPDILQSFTPGVPTNRVTELRTAGRYALTWENVRLHLETVADRDGALTYFPSTVRSVQVALFGTAQTLRGFDFLADDILFAYQSFNGLSSDFVDPAREGALDPGKSFLNATIGIADSLTSGKLSQGFDFAGKQLDANDSGYIEASEAAGPGAGQTPRLPWDNMEFVLYRPQTDTDGNFVRYNVSIERFTQAVPEPGCSWIIALAASHFLSRRRRS